MSWPHRVFVYGTLRREQSNTHWLTGARYLGLDHTAPVYTLFDTGPYPAAVADGATRLVGETYAIDDPILAALDELEGYPHWYTRRLIPTRFGQAWIYLWIAARDPRWPSIPGGDWTQR